jgi:hypothetical protein
MAGVFSLGQGPEGLNRIHEVCLCISGGARGESSDLQKRPLGVWTMFVQGVDWICVCVPPNSIAYQCRICLAALDLRNELQ